MAASWFLPDDNQGLDFFEDPPPEIGAVVGRWTTLDYLHPAPRYRVARFLLGAVFAAAGFMLALVVYELAVDHHSRAYDDRGYAGLAAAAVAWVMGFIALGRAFGVGEATCAYAGTVGAARHVRQGKRIQTEVLSYADVVEAKVDKKGDVVTYTFVGRDGKPLFVERANPVRPQFGEAITAAWQAYREQAGGFRDAAVAKVTRTGPRPRTARQAHWESVIAGVIALVGGTALPLAFASSHMGGGVVIISVGGLAAGFAWLLGGIIGLIRSRKDGAPRAPR